MAIKNINDLAQRTMEILGLLEAQEDVSSEDFALLSRIYENRYCEWQFRGLAYWPVAEIPQLAFESLAEMLAGEASSSFGVPTPIVLDENGQQVGVGVKGLRNMRRIIQVEQSHLPTVGQFY